MKMEGRKERGEKRKRGREDGREEGGKKLEGGKGWGREGGRKENKMVIICDKGNEVRGLQAMRKWHRDTYGGEGNVKMEAETGEMWPQVKESQGRR